MKAFVVPHQAPQSVVTSQTTTIVSKAASSAENPDRKKLALSKTTVDMLSGSCAGIVGTFVSHPLDTVKVRFQVSQ